jgi:hypothetical protein
MAMLPRIPFGAKLMGDIQESANAITLKSYEGRSTSTKDGVRKPIG